MFNIRNHQKINHELVSNVCERPSVVARCPVAAIRPAQVNGKPSLEVDEKKCICCGACYPPCPPMQINDAEHTKLSIWVGGNHSNARGKPTFQKLVAAGIPNNPQDGLKPLLLVKFCVHIEMMQKIGKELMIGLQKLDGLDFLNNWIAITKFHINNWKGARNSLNASTHIRF